MGKINAARDLRESFDLVVPRGHLESGVSVHSEGCCGV